VVELAAALPEVEVRVHHRLRELHTLAEEVALVLKSLHFGLRPSNKTVGVSVVRAVAMVITGDGWLICFRRLNQVVHLLLL
jgi:hypothetical protein